MFRNFGVTLHEKNNVYVLMTSLCEKFGDKIERIRFRLAIVKNNNGVRFNLYARYAREKVDANLFDAAQDLE